MSARVDPKPLPPAPDADLVRVAPAESKPCARCGNCVGCRMRERVRDATQRLGLALATTP